jgi:cytochrome c biogenesis protein CcdA/glutaredoxin
MCRLLPLLLAGIVIILAACQPGLQSPPQGGAVTRILYFHSVDCPHCRALEEEVLSLLQAQYGEQLDLQMLEIDTPANYELLVRAEELFDVAPEERGLPTLIVGGQVLIGEEQIRQELACLLDNCFAAGGTTWPEIPGLGEVLAGEEGAGPGNLSIGPGSESGSGEDVICEADEGTVCEGAASIWAGYFYETGCQECSRVKADIDYIRTLYPQLVYDEFNIYNYKDAALAQWLARRGGRDWESFQTPAIFIGDDALIGRGEITPQNLQALVEKYAPTGAAKVWEEFDTEAASGTLDEVFRSLGPLAVVFAGLVDGLNPCAFATIVFFISYLSLSGRQGREVLAVGGAFTLGVFIAYLAVGMGFYKVLELLGGLLTTLGRWVYGLTALLCAVLAVLSLLDFVRARRGEIGDMSLNLPHSLRMRINAIIRRGRRARTYVLGAFFTGLIVSFLELACTGQVYLPTIVAVMSRPEMRARAIFYLFLYNLLFILPLVVVFILAYYGTSSKQLTRFLQRRAALVKLGMVILFASLAAWLGLSLLV